MILFPRLTGFVRASIRRRLSRGACPRLIARQYNVSVRWLRDFRA